MLREVSVEEAAIAFNATLEGLGNAELRGNVLRVLPKQARRKRGEPRSTSWCAASQRRRVRDAGRSTAERVVQDAASLRHPSGTKCRHSSAERATPERADVVEIDGARGRNSVRSGCQLELETMPRTVRERGDDNVPIRSATGSRVRTSTGRSPPGVAANQISPRRICPVRPVVLQAPSRRCRAGASRRRSRKATHASASFSPGSRTKWRRSASRSSAERSSPSRSAQRCACSASVGSTRKLSIVIHRAYTV